jgi:uncharacterized protein (DUF983 family)
MAVALGEAAVLADVGNSESPQPAPKRQPFRQMVRAWLLRCPRCGQGKLFAGMIKMLPECPQCRLNYEREPGFYLGAIYFNYGLTSVIATIGFMVLRFAFDYPAKTALTITVTFAILFPVLYFRHARSLWLSFDQLIDPQ